MAKSPELTTTTNAASLVNEIAALATARRMGEVTTLKLPPALADKGYPDEVPALMRPDGSVESLAHLFRDQRHRPARVSGRMVVQDLDSLITLIRHHKVFESLIVVDRGARQVKRTADGEKKPDLPKPSITAIIDYHQGSIDDTDLSTPAWCGHRIHYPYPLSDRFAQWLEGDDQFMVQGEFALMLEDRITDLVSPADTERALYEPLLETRIATPSDLMTLGRNLEIYEKSNVKSGIRLSSGERQVVFESEHVDASGGAVKIPGLFMVSLPLFVGGEAVRMPVRLRYRLAGGKVLWAYQMWQVERYLMERITDDVATVREATGLTVVYGHEASIGAPA